MNNINKSKERKPYALWILMLTFALPIIAAYVYFFSIENPKTKNHGELIIPIIDIEKLELTNKTGNKLTREELTTTWRMLYFVGNKCDQACSKGLYNMRQLNIALGKNADRFNYMMIHLDTMNKAFSDLVQKEHPNALHAYAYTHTIKNIFSMDDQALFSNTIFIIDPLGNIMMKFLPEISPGLILKDLNHLLKVSRVG